MPACPPGRSGAGIPFPAICGNARGTAQSVSLPYPGFVDDPGSAGSPLMGDYLRPSTGIPVASRTGPAEQRKISRSEPCLRIASYGIWRPMYRRFRNSICDYLEPASGYWWPVAVFMALPASLLPSAPPSAPMGSEIIFCRDYSCSPGIAAPPCRRRIRFPPV